MDSFAEVVSAWVAPFAIVLIAVCLLGTVGLGLLVGTIVARIRRPTQMRESATEESALRESTLTQVEQIYVEPDARSPVSPTIRWLTRLSVASLVTAVLILGTVTIVNAFYFESAIGWICARIESSRGIKVQFDSASGSLWTGEVEFTGFHAQRADAERPFDVKVEDLYLDLAMPTLIAAPAFESVVAQRVTGEFRIDLDAEEKPPRREFEIRSFEMRAAKIKLVGGARNGRPLELPVEVDLWSVTPLRSNWLAHDLLLRSNAQGRVAGVPFEGQSEITDEKRFCRWKVSRLPIDVAAYAIGPPLAWLQEGKLDFALEEEASPPSSEMLQMKCQIRLRDLMVSVPENLPIQAQVAAAAVTGWLETHDRSLELEFPITMNTRQFANRLSPWGAGLEQAVANAMLAEMGRQSGTDVHSLRRQSAEAIERFQEMLGK